MIYLNMGHNDMDYETKPGKALSSTFASAMQDRLILNALEWLGTGKKPEKTCRQRKPVPADSRTGPP